MATKKSDPLQTSKARKAGKQALLVKVENDSGHSLTPIVSEMMGPYTVGLDLTTGDALRTGKEIFMSSWKIVYPNVVFEESEVLSQHDRIQQLKRIAGKRRTNDEQAKLAEVMNALFSPHFVRQESISEVRVKDLKSRLSEEMQGVGGVEAAEFGSLSSGSSDEYSESSSGESEDELSDDSSSGESEELESDEESYTSSEDKSRKDPEEESSSGESEPPSVGDEEITVETPSGSHAELEDNPSRETLKEGDISQSNEQKRSPAMYNVSGESDEILDTYLKGNVMYSIDMKQVHSRTRSSSNPEAKDIFKDKSSAQPLFESARCSNSVLEAEKGQQETSEASARHPQDMSQEELMKWCYREPQDSIFSADTKPEVSVVEEDDGDEGFFSVLEFLNNVTLSETLTTREEFVSRMENMRFWQIPILETSELDRDAFGISPWDLRRFASTLDAENSANEVDRQQNVDGDGRYILARRRSEDITKASAAKIPVDSPVRRGRNISEAPFPSSQSLLQISGHELDEKRDKIEVQINDESGLNQARRKRFGKFRRMTTILKPKKEIASPP